MNPGRIAPPAGQDPDAGILADLDLVEETCAVGGFTFDLIRPRSAEALIDQREYDQDERLPYWAEPWPSGRVLGDEIALQPLQDLRVIELGCGLGLPALVAAARGAKVIATDWYPAALAVLRENVRRNLPAPIETIELDWLNPPSWIAERERFDLVLGADILYELRYAGALTEIVPRLVAPDGEALIADPRRAYAGEFVEHMVDAGWAYELTERKVTGHVDDAGPIVRLHRLRPPQTPA